MTTTLRAVDTTRAPGVAEELARALRPFVQGELPGTAPRPVPPTPPSSRSGPRRPSAACSGAPASWAQRRPT